MKDRAFLDTNIFVYMQSNPEKNAIGVNARLYW
jgi:predicted nucleic acid-binding protein